MSLQMKAHARQRREKPQRSPVEGIWSALFRLNSDHRGLARARSELPWFAAAADRDASFLEDKHHSRIKMRDYQ